MSDTLSPYFKGYYSWKAAFAIGFFEALEPLQKNGNGLLTDKQIASKVERLKVGMISFDIDNGKKEGYVQVRVLGLGHREDEKYGRLDGKDMTLLELFQIFDDIKLSAIEWLHKNSRTKYDLNLSPSY